MASCARRTVQLEEDDLPYRKGSNATVRSEGTGTEYYAKRGMLPSYDSQETVRASRPVSTASNSSMRVRRLSSLTDDNTRFPKLQDCAHFHYDTVDINSLKVCLCDDDNEQYHHNGESTKYFYVKITSNDKTWLVRRTLQNFRMLDQKLHRCIFDRKFSHLPDVALIEPDVNTEQEIYGILSDYLTRFTSLAGSMLNCGSVLNWLEIDNRGNRILAVDDSGINTPAIAAAHAVKRYTAQAADEISLEVGDIISVIDMPPTEDTIWWRGKRGFEVGFFPYECVEVIGDKVPQAVVSGIPETPQNRALLKKHGKFISFLRLFFNTRPARIQLKQSGIVKERVFGCDLGEHLLNSGHDVPLVLKSCADVIESHGLVDGIYRLSGITSNIQKLRLAFDEDRVPDLTSEEYLQDVHSISSLLKMYFRELPNPLLTYQLYDKFANAVKDEENKLLRIHDVVQQLPPPHYRTTEYLMRHLARVAAHGHETGMHSKNLAIVWAPNLLRMTVKKANICPFDVSLKDKFQKIVASGRKQPQGEDEQPEADETEHVIDDVEMEMGEIDEPESLAMAPAKHQKKSKVMRVRWMEAETSELLKYAHEYLEKRKTPSRNVCKSFIASSKAAGGELHKRSADNILKKISAMNVKARKTDE